MRILIIFDTKILKKGLFLVQNTAMGGGKLLIHNELRSNISIIEDNTLSICSFTTNDKTEGTHMPVDTSCCSCHIYLRLSARVSHEAK